MTGTASHLDAGDAERVNTKTTNEIMKEVAEEKSLPVIQLNKYENGAMYEDIEATGDILVAFALHMKEKTVHFQYLYLESCATLTTTIQQTQVEEISKEGEIITVYRLENVEDDQAQYFSYITRGGCMISIGTNMKLEEFCDFLKDLSIK